MSNERQETIADIVAEMRSNEFDDPSFNVYSLVAARTLARGWADRIEAAAKREREAGAEAAQICGEIGEMVGREATTEKSSAVGNAGTVREVAQEMLNTSMQAVTAERINGWATRLAEVCEQPVTDCNQFNNAAAMREALVQVSRIAVEMTRKTITGEPEDRKTVDRWALRLCDIACAALSAPPRNCDVGTAEEQDARHSKWCRKYGIDGDMEVACAHQDMNCTLCALRWAQMPYGEGGAKC